MNYSSTAIALFAYSRADHLRTTLSALSLNAEASLLDLLIFLDGPRGSLDISACAEVAKVCNEPWAFKKVTVIQRKVNFGLYNSLTIGIGETLEIYNSVIVIEDDLFSSPYLLRYFLDALSIYQDHTEVASIHGYTPPVRSVFPETFFLRGADCWGWATWRDRWKLFRHDAAEMAEEIRRRGLVYEFNLKRNYDYLGMLDARAAGLNNSWAICWHASCFLENKLTLYPGQSLVRNIGLDGSGEHCGPSELMESQALNSPLSVTKIAIEVNPRVFSNYCKHFAIRWFIIHRIKALVVKIREKMDKLRMAPEKSGLFLTGPFETYDEAAFKSFGYEHFAILEKVYQATLNVLEGRSSYERDGTAFPCRPLDDNLRRLLITYLQDDDILVDFGGGLGGTFINNRDLFSDANEFIVIEQPSFSEVGEKLARSYNLNFKFISDINCLVSKPNIIIFSSVLQYIPNAQQVLLKAFELQPRLILIDRTAFVSTQDAEQWWIQSEPNYYSIPISYPIRPLRAAAIVSMLSDYCIVEEWTNSFDPEVPQHSGILLKYCA